MIFLERVFHECLEESDILGVNEEWKMSWSTSTRSHYWLFVFSNTFFFFSSRRRHTRLTCDWSSDVCSSDLTCDSCRAYWNTGQDLAADWYVAARADQPPISNQIADRKSTRLNSSHMSISYAVFCLKKKNNRGKDHPATTCLIGLHRPHAQPL